MGHELWCALGATAMVGMLLWLITIMPKFDGKWER